MASLNRDNSMCVGYAATAGSGLPALAGPRRPTLTSSCCRIGWLVMGSPMWRSRPALGLGNLFTRHCSSPSRCHCLLWNAHLRKYLSRSCSSPRWQRLAGCSSTANDCRCKGPLHSRLRARPISLWCVPRLSTVARVDCRSLSPLRANRNPRLQLLTLLRHLHPLHRSHRVPIVLRMHPVR